MAYILICAILILLPSLFIYGFYAKNKRLKDARKEVDLVEARIKTEKDLIENLSNQNKIDKKQGEEGVEAILSSSLNKINNQPQRESVSEALFSLIIIPEEFLARLVSIEFEKGRLIIHGEALDSIFAEKMISVLIKTAQKKGFWKIDSQKIIENSSGIFEVEIIFLVNFDSKNEMSSK